MTIQPIAYFRSPLTGKFGIPRQSGIAGSLVGEIVLCKEYRNGDAIRGIEDFDYLWLIWEFSENSKAKKHPTVRPPRLGGNRHIGVFATRSPFRPNNLALSSVRLLAVETTDEGPILKVAGADLMDGTPIYDIKPYVTFTDSHPDAKSGFADSEKWQTLNVTIPDDIERQFANKEDVTVIKEILAQDPRPQYHDSGTRIYGMSFRNMNIRFRVEGGEAVVLSVECGVRSGTFD